MTWTKLMIQLPICLLVACASTEVRDPRTGKVIFRTHADATKLTFISPGVTFRVDVLNHSTPTLAQGQAAQGKINAIGAAVATSGILSILK